MEDKNKKTEIKGELTELFNELVGADVEFTDTIPEDSFEAFSVLSLIHI